MRHSEACKHGDIADIVTGRNGSEFFVVTAIDISGEPLVFVSALNGWRAAYKGL